MTHARPISRVIDLTDPAANCLFNMTLDEARCAVTRGDLEAVRRIQGSFALLGMDGQTARLARSMDRPLRYFLAKRHDGPCLIAADRIDAIHRFLDSEGLAGQFHPSYTRMVPAHHIAEIALVGCPDPSPVQRRFFEPKRATLPNDLDGIGRAYVTALQMVMRRWLTLRATTGPIGVLFSGGIDSGAVFLVAYHTLLSLGESPSRLKAFTLAIDGEAPDLTQARAFLNRLGLELFLEPIEVPRSAVDWRPAVAIVEDYKPLDIQAAAMGLVLCRGIRDRYPDWRYLLDGDGGDENLKDYPIEENPELTIRSVFSNPMLYQEGWGVHSLKHSQTYSGGLSRGYVRSYAPARSLGFEGFSPFTCPELIEVAEAIPFIELTGWRHDELYRLKGEVLARGVKAITGLDMPVFPKRRFQHGAVANGAFAEAFPNDAHLYRRWFHARYEQPSLAAAE